MLSANHQLVAVLIILSTLILGIATNLNKSYVSGQQTEAGNRSNNKNSSSQPSAVANVSSSKENTLAPPHPPIGLAITPHPVPFSDLQKLRLQQQLKEVNRLPELPKSTKPVQGPTNGTQATINGTQPNRTKNFNDTVSPSIQNSAMQVTTLKQQIKLLANRTLAPSETSSILETSVANKGKLVFYTGNWFAARSADDGLTWSYINPTSTFRNSCCDFKVIYDNRHAIFIWYMQGIKDPDTGENEIKIGVSRDTAHWWFYSIRAPDLNSTWTHQWLDYPEVALGAKYFYFTSNMFNDEDYTRAIIVRMSLDDLANERAPHFSVYQDSARGNSGATIIMFTPVQGATNTMYWASHITNAQMKLYQWNESLLSSGVKTFIRDIPPWTDMVRGLVNATGPDGNNWAARSDSRITSGWMANGLIGFLWNADRGGKSTNNATFPWPYINAATFKVSDNMTYVGRPYMWSPDFAWLYGYISPDKNGNLGAVAFFGGGKFYPSVALGMRATSSGLSQSWNMRSMLNGTHGPAGPSGPGEWGDYVTLRPINGTGPGWVASGWTLQGGNQDNNVEPRFFKFESNNGFPSTTLAMTNKLAVGSGFVHGNENIAITTDFSNIKKVWELWPKK